MPWYGLAESPIESRWAEMEWHTVFSESSLMQHRHSVSSRPTKPERSVRSSYWYSFCVSSKLFGTERSHQIRMQVEAARCNQITARLLGKHCCCTLECKRRLSTAVVGIFYCPRWRAALYLWRAALLELSAELGPFLKEKKKRKINVSWWVVKYLQKWIVS